MRHQEIKIIVRRYYKGMISIHKWYFDGVLNGWFSSGYHSGLFLAKLNANIDKVKKKIKNCKKFKYGEREITKYIFSKKDKLI